MSSPRSPEHFRRNLAWVTLAHLILLLFLLLWALMKPAPPPPIKFLNMLNKGDLVKGVPGPSIGPVVGKNPAPAEAAPPAPSPKAAPEPLKPTPPAPQPKAVQPPEPTPVTPPAPEPTVAPEPTPAPPMNDPNSWSANKKKPAKPAKPTPPNTSTSTAKPKPKHQVKVNLEAEVERPSDESSSSAKSNKSQANAKVSGNDPAGRGHAREGLHGMTPDGIAEKLGKELQNSGVANAVKIGPSGSPNGTGGENSWYYTLIRDQMYQSWDMPTGLSGSKLQTLIRIFVEKNGSISKVDLVRSSGNKEHDDSALAAVRRVRRISQPLPDGMDGNIDINFRLTE